MYEDMKKDLTETVSCELEEREEHTRPEDLNENTLTEALLGLQNDIMDSLE